MKELLNKYKNGTLTSPDEQEVFIHELLQIRAQRSQQTSTIIAPKEAIIRQLNPFLRKVATKKYLAAAACILMACFTFWKFSAQISEPENTLQADIMSVSNNLKGTGAMTRGSLVPENNGLESASDLYEKKNFQGIINELEGKMPMSENEYLFLGLAYANLKTPNFSKALDYFKKVQSSDCKQDILMMTAICHIGLSQKGAARPILDVIKNDEQQGNEHRKRAGRLLIVCNK